MGTTELVDVVSLVTQAIWADMRRNGRAIEPTQWATLRLVASGPWTMSELARHKAVSLPTMSKTVDMLASAGGWSGSWTTRIGGRHWCGRPTRDGRSWLIAAVRSRT